MEKALNLG
jgi:hypothetical protein